MTLDTVIKEGIADAGTFDLMSEWLEEVSHEMMREGRDRKKGKQTMGLRDDSGWVR